MDGEIDVGMGLKILYLQVAFVSKYSFYSKEKGISALHCLAAEFHWYLQKKKIRKLVV